MSYDFSPLRLRSIFATPENEFNIPMNFQPQANPMEEAPYDPVARMKELYTPEVAATERYNGLINNQPEYERPSFLRTIGASLAAIGGNKAGADEIIEGNNPLNMSRWKTDVTNAKGAADQERQNNQIERQFANSTVSAELKNRADVEKGKNNDKINAIRERRAAVYEFKSKNPNMKILSPDGGNIIAVDPTDPTKVITLTDADGKPISSGSLSATDKENLKHKHEMEEIEKKTAGQVEVQGARSDSQAQLNETRGWEVASIPDPKDPSRMMGVRINKITGEIKPIEFGGQNPVITKPGGPGAGGKTPTSDPNALAKLQTRTKETMNAIDTLLDSKTGKLTSLGSSGVGKSRIFGTYKVPGTDAYTSNVTINNLKSRLVIDLIGEMKTQSKTGATGFGAMNVKELGILEAAIGKLDPSMDEEAFAVELKRIRDKLELIMRPTDGFTDVKAKPTRTAADMIKQYGGR